MAIAAEWRNSFKSSDFLGKRGDPWSSQTQQSLANSCVRASGGQVQANGPGAHQTVNHFHVHILPRQLGDQLPLNWAAGPGDDATIAALAEKIRAAMKRTRNLASEPLLAAARCPWTTGMSDEGAAPVGFDRPVLGHRRSDSELLR
jgi:HIT domain